MNCAELAELKAGLLCYGINVDKQAGRRLIESRPYFYDKGFVHAVNANICGSNVCFSVAEQFSGKSPYALILRGDDFYVEWGKNSVKLRLFDDLPRTGTVIDGLARPHSDNVISLWPSLVCCYDRAGAKCKFCSIKTTSTQTVVAERDVVYGLKALFDVTDKYSINLGGGTYINPNNAARYFINIIKGVREFTKNPISLELAPPADISLIDELYSAGVSSLIMNLEIASPQLRKIICPGKSSISYEHYYKCYRRAIDLLGAGRASCVLIAGIQPASDIIAECANLIAAGVVPTVIPFKAMDDCELHGSGNCDPAELLYISKCVGKMLAEHGLSPQMQEGCTKCGGCSLETNYCL